MSQIPLQVYQTSEHKSYQEANPEEKCFEITFISKNIKKTYIESVYNKLIKASLQQCHVPLQCYTILCNAILCIMQCYTMLYCNTILVQFL